MSKTLDNTNVAEARKNVSDLVTVGNGDMFRLLCKASSKSEGWMKSTKALEVNGVGCVVQVTTQQRNPDGSYSVAEALTFVPGVKMVLDANNGHKLVVYEDCPKQQEPKHPNSLPSTMEELPQLDNMDPAKEICVVWIDNVDPDRAIREGVMVRATTDHLVICSKTRQPVLRIPHPFGLSKVVPRVTFPNGTPHVKPIGSSVRATYRLLDGVVEFYQEADRCSNIGLKTKGDGIFWLSTILDNLVSGDKVDDRIGKQDDFKPTPTDKLLRIYGEQGAL